MNKLVHYYTREFLKSLCVPAQTTHISYFDNSVRNRWKRLKQKGFNKVRKHRAGWQVSLRRQTVEKMQSPKIILTNIPSLWGEIDNLTNYVQSKKHKNLGVVMLQETWLNPVHSNDSLEIPSFNSFRLDRPVPLLNRGGGVITYINKNLCKSCKIKFTFSDKTISCLSIECKFKFLSKYRSVVITNLYIAPKSSSQTISDFANAFSAFLTTDFDKSFLLLPMILIDVI